MSRSVVLSFTHSFAILILDDFRFCPQNLSALYLQRLENDIFFRQKELEELKKSVSLKEHELENLKEEQERAISIVGPFSTMLLKVDSSKAYTDPTSER